MSNFPKRVVDSNSSSSYSPTSQDAVKALGTMRDARITQSAEVQPPVNTGFFSNLGRLFSSAKKYISRTPQEQNVDSDLESFIAKHKGHCGTIDNVNDLLSSGDTLLHRAIKQGRLSDFSLLLEWGANPSIKNIDGKTPYRLLLEERNKIVNSEKNKDIVKLYDDAIVLAISHGADYLSELRLLDKIGYNEFRQLSIIEKHNSSRESQPATLVLTSKFLKYLKNSSRSSENKFKYFEAIAKSHVKGNLDVNLDGSSTEQTNSICKSTSTQEQDIKDFLEAINDPNRTHEFLLDGVDALIRNIFGG